MKAWGSALAELMRPSGNAFGFTCVLIMDLHVTLTFSILSPLSTPGLGSCTCVSSRCLGNKEEIAPLFALLGLLSGGVNNGELKQQGCLKPF